jgi:hypothetical protein
VQFGVERLGAGMDSGPESMKSEGGLRHFGYALLLAVVGYTVVYWGIEHRRNVKGPWEVTFTNAVGGGAVIIIEQPKLGISNVQIRFDGGTTALTTNSGRYSFGQARAVPFELPFGRCVFMDTTFLPGTVTMQVSGHEIELLPRVLTIDRQERNWESGSTIRLMAPKGYP